MSVNESFAAFPDFGLGFTYGVARDRLSSGLAECFVQSGPDAALAQFLQHARAQRAGTLKTFVFRSLQRVLSDYDAYATLRMYRMHLLGTEQWRALLDRDVGTACGSLLDIGAGDGGVTHYARPLFERICVTESSRALARILRRKGFEVFDHDLGVASWPSAQRFDVVSMLNVLDRTLFPRTLLANARALLAPGGTLLVSVPLPLRAHVHVGPHTVDPEESLPAARAGFEESANALAEELLVPAGLCVRRFSRVPYVSHGDSRRAFYVLDAALFACEG